MSGNQQPDNPLLWRQEDELNDAEKKVLKAFREDWKADDWPGKVVVPPESGSAPEKPAEGQTEADWQDAILRAGFLRDLFLGNYGKFDPRRIEISRAWIEGRLDLDYCESRLPLVFSRCIFSEGISLQNAIIPDLRLPGCNVRKFKDEDKRMAGLALFAQEAKVTASVGLNGEFKSDGEVFLHSADIGGQLVCDGGHFEEGLNAQQLKTGGNVFLLNGFKSNGEVHLNSAAIGGQLVCNGGHFEKGLNAENLKTGGNVFLLNGFKSNGEVHLNSAAIGGQLVCNGGHFEKGLNAENLKTGADVFLRNGFKSNGVVNLNGADIGGQLDCDGGHFEKGLMAQNLKTGETVFLCNGFKSNGEVNLYSADIGGQLACDGGHFEEGLMAQNLKTGGIVFLRNGFKSNGVVNLHSADISGQLDCAGGHFEEGLQVVNITVRKDFYLRGAHINGAVILDSAKVDGVFKNMSTWFTSPKRDESTLFRNFVGILHRRFLSLVRLFLWLLDVPSNQWSPRNSCSADGFCYREIEDSGDWKMGKAWLSQMQSARFSPQPYQQLMAVYRRMGHTNWARNIGHALEKRRSRAFGWLQLPWRIWYGILGLTIGYGYRPFGFFLWAAGLLTVGWFLFGGHAERLVSNWIPPEQAPTFVSSASDFVATNLSNEWIPSEGEALASQGWRIDREPPPDYLPFNPLIYSLESAFPVLNLGQLEKWHPGNRFLLWVRWALTLVGTLLLAILALFGAGVLGPRSQNGNEVG